jgi:hypothetical protein
MSHRPADDAASIIFSPSSVPRRRRMRAFVDRSRVHGHGRTSDRWFFRSKQARRPIGRHCYAARPAAGKYNDFCSCCVFFFGKLVALVDRCPNQQHRRRTVAGSPLTDCLTTHSPSHRTLARLDPAYRLAMACMHAVGHASTDDTTEP